MAATGLLIFNPAAGQGWRRPDPERIGQVLAEHGFPTRLLLTRGQDHATALVRAHLAPDTPVVWVCGGDGTVAQAATALVDSPVPLGILPSGTVNVVAWECGIPPSPFRAIRVLAGSEQQRTLRCWRVNGRAVLLGVGVGFEARAIGHADPRLKNWLGVAAVGLRGVREWARYEFPPLRISGEDGAGRRWALHGSQMLATNTRRYAGRHVVAPGADPTDDELDVLVLAGRSRTAMAGFWLGVQAPGTLHLRVPGVQAARARRLRVEPADGRPVLAHVNGDAVERTPLELEPWGRVRVLVP